MFLKIYNICIIENVTQMIVENYIHFFKFPWFQDNSKWKMEEGNAALMRRVVKKRRYRRREKREEDDPSTRRTSTNWMCGLDSIWFLVELVTARYLSINGRKMRWMEEIIRGWNRTVERDDRVLRIFTELYSVSCLS